MVGSARLEPDGLGGSYNFIFEYCLSKVLIEKNIRPDFLLGYSLGEYVALTVSGILSLEEGLRLVQETAILIDSGTTDATMLAILAHTHKER